MNPHDGAHGHAGNESKRQGPDKNEIKLPRQFARQANGGERGPQRPPCEVSKPSPLLQKREHHGSPKRRNSASLFYPLASLGMSSCRVVTSAAPYSTRG